MKIALIGFGTVGQGFIEILKEKHALLAAVYGFSAQIVAVATHSRGTLMDPHGLDLDALMDAISQGHLGNYPKADGVVRDLPVEKIIDQCGADVLLEASWTNLKTGQPATDYCLRAFQNGQHVVLANKGPVALHYQQLADAARAAKKSLRFEGTVMAGTPSLTLAKEALAGCTISAAKGILNGSTNYMLTEMERGIDYEDVMDDAKAKGYLEADPTADVGGWDAASKAVILARSLFGADIGINDLDVSGIDVLSADDIAAAQAAGERYKLIAEVTPQGGSVKAVRLPLADPLAGVGGTTNAITFETDLLGPVTLVGAGAGRRETGFALLADVLAIRRQGFL
ncbi:MAG: homoserine dehydrogenase [Anaerolineaceae bacterium]|nr:homoserine dehydrogenase [Anaerolineaceae bacterium]